MTDKVREEYLKGMADLCEEGYTSTVEYGFKMFLKGRASLAREVPVDELRQASTYGLSQSASMFLSAVEELRK